MKVFVHEPPGQENITNTLKYTIDKYWKDCDLNIIKFGNEYRSPELWAENMYTYFSNIDDPFFILLLNDMLIMSDVNTELLKKLETYLKQSVGRIGLTADIEGRSAYWINHDGLIQLYSFTEHRLSIINSIWNRKYFLSYLKNVKTPWEFETQYQNDDNYILGTQGQYVMQVCNLLGKEKIRKDWQKDCFSDERISKIDEEKILKIINLNDQ